MAGRIEVIAGPMFSGKSTELLRRVRLARAERISVAVFKHSADTRYTPDEIVTHAAERTWALAVPSAQNLLTAEAAAPADVIAVDEAQFFAEDLVSAVAQWAACGRRVIVAGLDLDSFGAPFGPMLELMRRADELRLLSAVCARCGRAATHTYRRPGIVSTRVLVGGAGIYEPRCRDCWSAYDIPAVGTPAGMEPAAGGSCVDLAVDGTLGRNASSVAKKRPASS